MCIRDSDGPGHYNPDPSEGLWGGGVVTHHGGASSSPRPDTVRDYRRDHEVYEGRKQTGGRSAHAGSRLKLSDAPGRSRLICQPSSRTGENPPYGMIGGIEETSASFEARSAPRSYPTKSDVQPVLNSVVGPRFELKKPRIVNENLS